MKERTDQGQHKPNTSQSQVSATGLSTTPHTSAQRARTHATHAAHATPRLPPRTHNPPSHRTRHPPWHAGCCSPPGVRAAQRARHATRDTPQGTHAQPRSAARRETWPPPWPRYRPRWPHTRRCTPATAPPAKCTRAARAPRCAAPAHALLPLLSPPTTHILTSAPTRHMHPHSSTHAQQTTHTCTYTYTRT